MEREIFLLESGIRVVYQRSDSRLVHFGMLVSSGSRDEGESTGCAHLLEHMMFKRTKSRSFEELLEYIEGVGGEFNAYTSREETCYYISMLNDYYVRPIDVLSDLLFDIQFLEEELKKEKEVVVDEINFYNDTPSELIVDDFEQKLFSNNSLGNRILGTEESVRNITINELGEFYKFFYAPSNIVLSFIGDVPFEDVKKCVNNYFNRSITEIKPQSTRVRVSQTEYFKEEVRLKTSQVHCIIGCNALRIDDPRRFEMYLFNNYFGGSSFNSILNLSLREKNGLTYNIESNYSPYTDSGVFSVYFGTDNKKVGKCLDIIHKEINKVKSGGVSDTAFQMYKTQIIGQLAIASDNLLNEMILNAKNLLYCNTILSFEEIENIYKTISKSDVECLLQEYVDVETMSMLLYK